MKKLICLVLSLFVFAGAAAGCQKQESAENFKFTTLHNSSIKLDQSQEEITKAEDLMQDGDYYVKQSAALINGLSFEETNYGFEDHKLVHLSYSKLISDEESLKEPYEQIVAYVTEIYGVPQETKERYAEWKISDSSGNAYRLSVFPGLLGEQYSLIIMILAD